MNSKTVILRSAAPAVLAAAIFMVIAAVTGGDRKTITYGGAFVGALTFVLTLGISAAITKIIAARR